MSPVKPVIPVTGGRRRLPAALAAVSAAALLLAGCDSDGTGVPDAGSHDDGDSGHTDTALSGELPETQGAPEPTTGGAPQPTPGAPQPTTGTAADSGTPQDAAPGATTTVSYGNYLVPLGADGSTTMTCSFNGDPAAEGFAWACEAPTHLGWTATDGGEANSVAYRPGADPEVYAVLGNSGVTASDTLPAAATTTVGDSYSVDTTGDATTVTDTSTGVAVRLADGGYTQL